MKSARQFFVTTLALLFFCGRSAAADTLSLKAALTADKVSLKAIYNKAKKGLAILVKNKTSSALMLSIDPALIFKPEKSTYQDLVVSGQPCFTLDASGSKELFLPAFCAKCFGVDPINGLSYTFSKQGDELFQTVLRFIKDSGAYSQTAQNAVWVMTNGHKLATVYNPVDSARSVKLVKMIAEKRKMEVPAFTSRFEMHCKQLQNGTKTMEMQAPADENIADLRWGYEHRHMFVTVYRADGSVYRKIDSGDMMDKDGHHIIVTLNPANDPPGRYTVDVRDEENKVWITKELVVR